MSDELRVIHIGDMETTPTGAWKYPVLVEYPIVWTEHYTVLSGPDFAKIEDVALDDYTQEHVCVLAAVSMVQSIHMYDGANRALARLAIRFSEELQIRGIELALRERGYTVTFDRDDSQFVYVLKFDPNVRVYKTLEHAKNFFPHASWTQINLNKWITEAGTITRSRILGS